jgi:hypothetical protein
MKTLDNELCEILHTFSRILIPVSTIKFQGQPKFIEIIFYVCVTQSKFTITRGQLLEPGTDPAEQLTQYQRQTL